MTGILIILGVAALVALLAGATLVTVQAVESGKIPKAIENLKPKSKEERRLNRVNKLRKELPPGSPDLIRLDTLEDLIREDKRLLDQGDQIGYNKEREEKIRALEREITGD